MKKLTTVYTLDEFNTIQKDQKHPYVGLFNIDGSRLIAFNPHGSDPKEKITEIKRALKSPSLGDGVYVIKCKNSLSKNINTFDYPVIVGNPEQVDLSEDPQKDTIDFADQSVTSYKNVLDLNVRIKELEFENKSLKSEIENLEDEIDTLEDEIEESDDSVLSEVPSNMDRISQFGESLMQIVTPLVDKHFELKERKIALEEKAIGTPKQASDENLQKDAVDYTDKKIQEYIQLYDQEDKLFDQMAEVYNSAQSLDEFFVTFKENIGEDKFNEMINFINNKTAENGQGKNE